MKTLFLAAALAAVSLAFGGGAKPAANYAGAWTLDKQQSKGLPPYYDRVKSHRLVVTQDEQHLNVAVEVDTGQPEPDRLNFVYNLDGTETKTETMIRTPEGRVNVPTTLKATVGEAGKIQITITRDLQMPGKVFKGVTVEDWELSADGKTLTIHRADDTPRGKMQADMVFLRG